MGPHHHFPPYKYFSSLTQKFQYRRVSTLSTLKCGPKMRKGESEDSKITARILLSVLSLNLGIFVGTLDTTTLSNLTVGVESKGTGLTSSSTIPPFCLHFTDYNPPLPWQMVLSARGTGPLDLPLPSLHCLWGPPFVTVGFCSRDSRLLVVFTPTTQFLFQSTYPITSTLLFYHYQKFSFYFFFFGVTVLRTFFVSPFSFLRHPL